MLVDDLNQYPHGGQIDCQDYIDRRIDRGILPEFLRQEPLIYLKRPGFFAHLWRDPAATSAWRDRGADLTYLTQRIIEAQGTGNERRIKDALAAKADLCRKIALKRGTPIRQRCYSTDELLSVLRFIDPATDNWISQSIFRRRRRRIADLRTLGSTFADLDYYKTKRYSGRSSEIVAQALQLAVPTRACQSRASLLIQAVACR